MAKNDDTERVARVTNGVTFRREGLWKPHSMGQYMMKKLLWYRGPGSNERYSERISAYKTIVNDSFAWEYSDFRVTFRVTNAIWSLK